MKRYCVLSSPRSGTEYLIDIIKKNFISNKLDYYDFNEIFNFNWYGYNTPDEIVSNYGDFDSDSRKKHMEFFDDVIENTDNNVICKVFLSQWIVDKIDVIDYFKKLKKNNFEILYLKRNFNDRLLSLLVAKHTKVWHRWQHDDYTYFNNEKDCQFINAVDKIKIEINDIFKYWMECKIYEHNSNRIIYDFDVTPISYERLCNDINDLGLTVPDIINTKKLYDFGYGSVISNYEEVLRIINWLNQNG